MQLVVDAREACKAKKAGKAMWTYAFIDELLKRDIHLKFLSDFPLPPEWQTKNLELEVFQTGFKWHLKAVTDFKKSCKNNGQIYISPTSYLVPYLLGKKYPYLPIIHDLIAFQHEPHDKKAKFIERLTLSKTVKNARHICVNSATTKRDLLKRFAFLEADNISVIYAGPLTKVNSRQKQEEKYILHIGTLCPRKNQLRLIQAYTQLPDILRKEYKLILAGDRGWHDNEIIRLAKSTPGVEWRGYLPTKDCQDLLEACTVFAWPSLYEGFGMPVLDALRLGVPVLTSEKGSLKEITGDCAMHVNPESIGSIREGLQFLLTNQNLRKDLRLHGPRQADKFSWKRTVDLFLRATREIKN